MAEYIKREYAVDAVLDVYYDTPDIDLSGEKFEAAIRKIQAADVAAVRHGRWIIKKRHTISSNSYMDDDYFASANCSECNFCVESKIASFSFPKLNTTSYCPNCGAKMDLED